MKLLDRLLGPNVERLRSRGDREGLTRVLEHPRPELRQQAIEAIADLAGAAAVETFITGLDDGDSKVRDAARNALTGLGDQVAPQLGAALGEESEQVSRVALELLVAQEPPAMTTLISVLKEGNDLARPLAITALRDHQAGLAGEVQESGFRALLAALGDRLPEVRSAAAAGLGSFADSRAAKALVAQLKDGTEAVRNACSDALRQIGVAAVPYLSDALADRNANARAGAAGLLGELAADAEAQLLEEVAGRLRTAAGDRAAVVREQAVAALEQLAIPLTPPEDQSSEREEAAE